MHVCQSYLSDLFHKDKRDKTIAKYVKVVNRIKQEEYPDIYALAVCGTSGILGAMIADWCNLELIVVRSATTKAHSTHKAEGAFKNGGYLFFDDLIDSGATVYHVWKSIRDEVYNINADGGILDWDTNTRTKVELPHIRGAVLYSSSWGNYPDARPYMYIERGDTPKLPVWTK